MDCFVHGSEPTASFHPFRSPLGMERSIEPPCSSSSAPSLDAEQQRLPVAHCMRGEEDNRDRGFFWFYVARGCSDVVADLGRHVVARNRCHAAELLSDYSG
eukprot:6122720-Prymnesium_polylepis.1